MILLMDLLFNQYSITYWLNPLSCASCVQKMSLEIFFPELKAYLIESKTSLISYLGAKYQSGFFIALFALFAALSFTSIVNTLIRAIGSMRLLRKAQKRASINKRVIKSEKLKHIINKKNIDIYVSDEIQVPLTVYPKILIIPAKTVEILSQQEYEAVIAHEVEHVRYQDPISRLVIHLISAFFWWIPMQSWTKKLELDQEIACDQNIIRYNLSSDSIAAALFKVAKQVKVHRVICCFTSSGNSVVLRVQESLGFKEKGQDSARVIALLGLVAWGVFLVICMMY